MIPKPNGGVAQLGEHLPCKQGVMGSIPIISTRSAVPTATLDEPNANIAPENEGCANKREREWNGSRERDTPKTYMGS